ncbi:unnamed protein product [Effrenium voratum]|nr:unnamed protein product [Effrenium voratum]
MVGGHKPPLKYFDVNALGFLGGSPARVPAALLRSTSAPNPSPCAELASPSSAAAAARHYARARGPDGIQTFVRWQDQRGRVEVSKNRGRRQEVSQALSPTQQQVLEDAVKQRANQLCLPSYTASFLRRQKLRAKSARQQVAVEANRFNSLYAQAQASIEGRLTFNPPARSNSVAMGQVVRCMHQEGSP